MLRERIYIILSVFFTLPWIISFILNLHYPPYVEAFLSGMAVVSASFLLSWAAETAEMDIPRSLSLAVVALIAVLPEYAVDMYFAYMAGLNPESEYVHYAAANMTGANRLLIGIGWSLVILYAIFKTKTREINLDENIRLEVSALMLATAYSFILPLKGHISLLDSVILVSLYIFYLSLAVKAPHEEFEVEGVPKYLCSFEKRRRRAYVISFFIFSALVIFISVEAFAEGLIQSAEIFNLDPFIMVQWVAPLASESPELIVAFYLARKLRVTASLNALISSKVNQWTLLIGTIAVVYSIASLSPSPLPLDARQREEVLLTAAQSLFATSIILNLSVSRVEGLLLFLLFIVQLIFPGVEVRLLISAIYIVLSVPVLLKEREEIGKSFRHIVKLTRS
jgi:cation:H+ antiporter